MNRVLFLAAAVYSDLRRVAHRLAETEGAQRLTTGVGLLREAVTDKINTFRDAVLDVPVIRAECAVKRVEVTLNYARRAFEQAQANLEATELRYDACLDHLEKEVRNRAVNSGRKVADENGDDFAEMLDASLLEAYPAKELKTYEDAAEVVLRRIDPELDRFLSNNPDLSVSTAVPGNPCSACALSAESEADRCAPAPCIGLVFVKRT